MAISEFKLGFPLKKWLEDFDLLMTENKKSDDESKTLLFKLGGEAIRKRLCYEYQTQLPPDCPYSEVRSRLIELLETEAPAQKQAQAPKEENELISEDESDEEVDERLDMDSYDDSDEESEPEKFTIRLTINVGSTLDDHELFYDIYLFRLPVEADAGPSFLKQIQISGVVKSLGDREWSFRIVLEDEDERIVKIKGSFTAEAIDLAEQNLNRRPLPSDILCQVAGCVVAPYLNGTCFETTWSLIFTHGEAQASELTEKGIMKLRLTGPQEEARRLSTVIFLDEYVYRAKFTRRGS